MFQTPGFNETETKGFLISEVVLIVPSPYGAVQDVYLSIF